MEQIDLLSLEKATKQNGLVHQLFCLKRCFGSTASIGIVVSSGKVDRCRTVSELILLGHVESEMGWIDKFLPNVPKISVLPRVSEISITTKRMDGGPPCPWDVARLEMEAAKQRIAIKKEKRRALSQMVPTLLIETEWWES